MFEYRDFSILIGFLSTFVSSGFLFQFGKPNSWFSKKSTPQVESLRLTKRSSIGHSTERWATRDEERWLWKNQGMSRNFVTSETSSSSRSQCTKENQGFACRSICQRTKMNRQWSKRTNSISRPLGLSKLQREKNHQLFGPKLLY